MVKGGAIEAAVALMRAHAASSEVQNAGVEALSKIVGNFTYDGATVRSWEGLGVLHVK